jgi:hypothetical protein
MKAALVLAALLLLAARAPGAEGSLGRGIPDDCFLYLSRRANPQRAFLDPSLEATRKAVEKARLADLLLDSLVERRVIVKDEVPHWRRVIQGVAWDTLLAREYALGVRFDVSWLSTRREQAEPNPVVDWIVLFRVDPARRDAELTALRKLVLALATLGDQEPDPETGRRISLEVTDSERDGVPTTFLATQEGETKIGIGGRGDVIVAASSPLQMRRSLKLLAGDGSGRGLPEGQEFTRLMAPLPPPTDGECVLRPRLIFNQLKLSAQVMEKAHMPAEEVQALEALVETLDVVSSVAVSESTEGRKLLGSFRVEIVPAAVKRSLYRAFGDRPALGNFRNLVPREASGFLAWSGLDLERLHDAMTEFLTKVSPDGLELLDDYRHFQEKNGFDVKRDLLSLIEGRVVVLTFPAPGKSEPSEGGNPPPRATPRSPIGQWVALFKLKDPGRAEAKLGEWLGKAAEGLKAIGMEPQKAEMAEVPGSFQRIALPFPPGMEITFGVSGDELAIGPDRERIRQAFLVRTGKVEPIEGNGEWGRLALSPRGDLLGIGYRDMRDLAVQVGTMVGGLSLAAELIPDSPQGKRPFGKSLILMAQKLGPILSTALGSFDRAGCWLGREGTAFQGAVAVTVSPEQGRAVEAPPPGEKKPAPQGKSD